MGINALFIKTIPLGGLIIPGPMAALLEFHAIGQHGEGGGRELEFGVGGLG